MGRHARSRTPWASLIAVLVAAAVVAGIAFALLRQNDPAAGDDDPAPSGSATSPTGEQGTDCAPLTVAAAPEVAALLTEVVAAAKPCAEITVQETLSADYVDDLATGQSVAPAWVTNSDSWVQVYEARRGDNADLPQLSSGEPVASTPVVLAVPGPLASAKTTGPHAWIDGLAALPLSAANSRQSTPTALAFTAVWQQFANLPGGTDSVSDAFFSIIRSQVETPEAFAAGADKATAKAFPETEQAIAAWNQEHPDEAFSALTPTAGMPQLAFSLVRTSGADDALTKTMDELQTLLSGPAQEAFAKAGFRPADGTLAEPLVDGVPATLPSAAVEVDPKEFGAMLRDMQRIVRKQSVLTVVDVSGSMLEKAGTATRMALAVSAVGDSLAELGDDARAGLWVFSSDRGPGRDWEAMVPVRTLGPAKDTKGHRAALAEAVAAMPSKVRGDTGLFDTIWASYASAQKNYQEGTEALVMVLTDGVNDDPTGGMDEKQLISKLKKAQDPQRPVRLVLIGMGPSTDIKAMRRVSDAIDGLTTSAANPGDISAAFASALWSVSPQSRK